MNYGHVYQEMDIYSQIDEPAHENEYAKIQNGTYIKVENQIKAEGVDTIYYTEEMKDNIEGFLQYAKIADNSKSMLITSRDMGEAEQKQYIINYKKMGENYGEVPQDVYSKQVIYECYPLNGFIQDTTVYPGIYTKEAEGIAEDGWTGAKSTFHIVAGKEENADKLVIDMRDYYNYNVEKDANKVKIKIKLNDKYVIELAKLKEDKLYFEIGDITEEITQIQILCPTFNMDRLKKGTDNRNLGINVERIYYE